MSVPAIRSLAVVQIGKEDTAGTAVAATRRLAVRQATYRRMEDEYVGDEELTGTLARTASPPIATKRWTEFELTMPLDFDQSLLAALSGVNSDVTPTPDGGLFVWEFSAPADDAVVPETYTLEYQEMAPGGDADGMRCPFGFTTGFTLAGGDNGVADLSISMVGRATQDQAATADLALVPIERAPVLKWAAYMNNSWAALGDTQILGQIYNFTYEFRDHIRPEWYLYGSTDLSFSQYEVGHRVVDVAFDVVVDPASGGFVPTERAAKDAHALRFARLEIAGTGETPQMIQLDGAYYHASDSLQERGGDRNGSNIVRVHLLSAYDPTEGTDFLMRWITSVDEFPVMGS